MSKTTWIDCESLGSFKDLAGKDERYGAEGANLGSAINASIRNHTEYRLLILDNLEPSTSLHEARARKKTTLKEVSLWLAWREDSRCVTIAFGLNRGSQVLHR